MSDPAEVQRVVESFVQNKHDVVRLQSEVDRLTRALKLQEHEADRLNFTITQLSAERDHYMTRCAVLNNDLSVVKNIIDDTLKKARDVSFGRERIDPAALPLDDPTALAQISYAKRRRDN